MTQTEFRERIDSMIETEYEAIGGDKFKQQVGEEMVDKLVLSAYSKRLKAELELDPEFHKAWCLNVAGEDVQRYISERRPVGSISRRRNP